MGLEAYRIELKLLDNVKRNVILQRFDELGYNIVGHDFGSIYLAKANEYGFIEIAMENSELHRIALNQYKMQHNRRDYIVTQPADDKEQLIIQIAKPNHENIIDCLMEDARDVNRTIPINVINLQSKEKIDLNNYRIMKEHFKNAKDEFGKYYSKPTYPIRCRDVFKTTD